MPLTLSLANEEDLPKIVNVQFAAFASDEIQRFMYPFPTPPPTFEQALIRARIDFPRPECAFVKVMDTDIGELVAFAKWLIYKHERPEEEWNKQEKRTWAEGTNAELANEFIGAINEKRRKIMKGTPHCLLNILDTLPEHQRRGAGTQLVRWGVELADRHGLPCYLEASPAGHHLYRKFGFEDVEMLEVDLTPHGGHGKHGLMCMIRPPNKKVSNIDIVYN